jgi:hypothetical protein
MRPHIKLTYIKYLKNLHECICNKKKYENKNGNDYGHEYCMMTMDFINEHITKQGISKWFQSKT